MSANLLRVSRRLRWVAVTIPATPPPTTTIRCISLALLPRMGEVKQVYGNDEPDLRSDAKHGGAATWPLAARAQRPNAAPHRYLHEPGFRPIRKDGAVTQRFRRGSKSPPRGSHRETQ